MTLREDAESAAPLRSAVRATILKHINAFIVLLGTALCAFGVLSDCEPDGIAGQLATIPRYEFTATSTQWSDESWADPRQGIRIARYAATSKGMDFYKMTIVCCESAEVAKDVYLRYTIHESTGGTPTDMSVGDAVVAFGDNRLWIRWGTVNVAIIADNQESQEHLSSFVKAIDSVMKRKRP